MSEEAAARGVDDPDAEGPTVRARATIRFAEKGAGQYIGFGRMLAKRELEVAGCPI